MAAAAQAPVQEDAMRLRIRGEYLEMPGLRLTAEQARRLWSLDLGTCRSLLEALVAQNFLRRSGDGKYSRRFYT